MDILRGEVYHIDLEPTKGQEMKKSHRPCVVVSNNIINEKTPVIIICPITDSYNKFSPIHIEIPNGEGGLTKKSVVHCGQVRAIDKLRMGSKLGILNSNIMQQVSDGLRQVMRL